LGELLTKYEDIFAMDSDVYGRTDRVYHRIDMGERPDRFANPRGFPYKNRRK
jgi:hypothetical protein